MRTAKLILPLLVGALTLAACDDTGTTGPGTGEARLSLLLTDAPGELQAAVVTITDIYLQPREGEGGERIYLRQGEGVTTDLLTLQNDVLELVDDETIPAGHYEQLRFVITGGYIEVEQADGGSTIYASSPTYPGLPEGITADGELVMPSFASSGLKVILNGGRNEQDDGSVVLEGDQTLLVDFDVARSFGKQAGNSGKWVMKPTLKATSLQAAAGVTVKLSLSEGVTLPLLGTTAITLAGFRATITPAAGGDAKSTAFTDVDGDGTFEASFPYLAAGDYQLGITGPAGITFQVDATLPIALSVTSGTKSSTALKLTAAALAPAPAQ